VKRGIYTRKVVEVERKSERAANSSDALARGEFLACTAAAWDICLGQRGLEFILGNYSSASNYKKTYSMCQNQW
jgi:hypothetical protein